MAVFSRSIPSTEQAATIRINSANQQGVFKIYRQKYRHSCAVAQNSLIKITKVRTHFAPIIQTMGLSIP